ncbi:MAG: hypothetical protein EHM80_15190, partial [Nitrospiraceae bacterium]
MYTGICLEDALISYRYAENLLEGHGFVFNHGERVLGTTTPLQTLMLAALARPFGAEYIPLISSIVMMLLGLGTGALIYACLVGSGYSRRLGLLATAVFLFHSDIIWSTTGGMETPLVLFLMASGLYAGIRHRWALLGLLSGLLILARIDGIIWAGGLSLVTVVRQRAAVRPILMSMLLVLVPWVVFATAYFGSPIPQSLLAKMPAISGLSARLNTTAIRHYFDWFANGVGVPTGGGFLPIEHTIWLVFVILGLFGVLRQHRRDPLLVIMLFPFLYGASFYLGGAPFSFAWYLVPFTWCCLILGVIGGQELWLMLA